ncbi:MAG: hypothetical protein ACRDC5_06800 [Vibrio sp.]
MPFTYRLEKGEPLTEQELDDNFRTVSSIAGKTADDIKQQVSSDLNLSKGYAESAENSAINAEQSANKLSPQTFESLRRSYAEAGYDLTGSFGSIVTITNDAQALLEKETSKAFKWTGALPKQVLESDNPVGSEWVSVSNELFRSILKSSDGAKNIGFIQSGSGAVPRDSLSKQREMVAPADFGAKGDGVTNDQTAFTAIDALPPVKTVDLLGLTYLVDTLPSNHEYINGFIKHSLDGYVYDANPVSLYDVGNRNVLLGGAGPSMPKWVKYRGPLLAYNVFGIGFEALHKNKSGRNLTAFGAGALHELENGRYNIAIGLESQYYCNSDDGASIRGCRNVSIGDNSLRFNVVGYSNCAMGRNASQVVLGNFNTHIGNGSVSGDAPLGLDDQTIVNTTPSSVSQSTVTGVNAGYYLSGGYGQCLFGYRAGYHLKSGVRNVAGGWLAMEETDKLCSYDGKVKSFVDLSGSYEISSGVITITIPSNSGIVVGGRVRAKLGSHEINYYQVSSVSGSDKVICQTSYVNISESGVVTISEIETLTDYGQQTVDCVAFGNHAMQYSEKCVNSVAHGAFAFRNLKSGQRDVACGSFAGVNMTSGSDTTLVGYGAGRYMWNGSDATSLTNVSILGANSSVSGDNQVQLGNSSTTTYVYGTVQNRSDARDKIDVEDTKLGIEFIMGLRPVDGRWNLREAYTTVGDACTLDEYRHDSGSKAGIRKHHWFIAQEVKDLCDKIGVDFGGYQDHKINGGCDVLSLGYDEFIPPTVKAVQQCWERMNALEERILKLESK